MRLLVLTGGYHHRQRMYQPFRLKFTCWAGDLESEVRRLLMPLRYSIDLVSTVKLEDTSQILLQPGVTNAGF
jgi:hypothetical protein